MKSSDLFVRQLEAEGVEYIFGLPGEENLDFLDSLRNSKIKLIGTRHEQAAAFMAVTYGRLTGKAGVCFATLGPGATNLVTGIAQAQLIGAPLISISGQKAVRDNRQAGFQLVDIVSLMKPITKRSVSIADPNLIPTVLRNAFKLAEAERPGAVHIELPEDIAACQADSAVHPRGTIGAEQADKQTLDRAVQLINEAKYPLIIVSAAGNRKPITKELLNLLDVSGIYVVQTQLGKGVVPYDSPHTLHSASIHRHDYVNYGFDIADLIITIGYHIIEYPPAVWNRHVDKNILHIDYVQAETDRYFNPSLEVIGDIAASLEYIAAEINKRRDFPVFKKAKGLLDSKLEEPVQEKYPPYPQQIVRQVRQALSKKDIITLDNGIYKLWFSRLYKTYERNTVLLDNALASMGTGLPSAIAAKLVHPDRKVLAICGDGGFMMNSQELETALRLDLPVVVLILNDNGFGFIKWEQKAKKFAPFGLDHTNPDFVAYARAYGAEGFRVEKGDNLAEVLKNAFALNKVALVECPIDYSINYDVFSLELKEMVYGLYQMVHRPQNR
ncbi:acetolactate synthase large subunit [candidate division KSB1 bacterium]